MRILVFCPLYPVPPRIAARTVKGIFALEWPEQFSVTFERSGQHVEVGYDDIARKYERGRRLALVGEYDAMLTVEADMVIPPDALTKLMTVDADVVRGLYVDRRIPTRWMLALDMHGDGAGTTIDHFPDEARKAWGNVVPSAGVGQGCTLIRRPVLERVGFTRDGSAPPDWWFALDVAKAGFRQAHHCGVVCGHIQGDKTYWPDPNAERLYQEETA